MAKFGIRLKQLRAEHNWTQQQLIDQFNKKYHYSLGKSAISQYEHNKRIPEIHVLMNFADFFDVSLDYLMGKTEIRYSIVKESSGKYQAVVDMHNVDLDKAVSQFVQHLGRKQMYLNDRPVNKQHIQTMMDTLEIGLEVVKRRQHKEG